MKTFHQQPLGKYVLLDKLAESAPAEIYRAIIPGVQGFNKLITVKKILSNLADDEELARMFIDAAKVAALLHHQNIVQIYDFGCIGNVCYVAMESLFGKDCHRIARKAGEKKTHVDLPSTLLILSKVCAGLDYAHKLRDFQGKPLQIIHRDINPRNIIITYDGEVKIIDFGIAAATGRTATPSRDIIEGKVAYMSPEQAAGDTIDARSDIFSCGIILYEMVTGKRMFDGETLQILPLVQEARFVKPEEIRQDLPEKLLQILTRSLAKNPNDRYQNCSTMQADLEDCLQQLGEHPTAASLSRYMKTLFAEEIIPEQEHIQELLCLTQDESTITLPSQPAGQDGKSAEEKTHFDYLKKTDVVPETVDDNYSIHSKKTLYTGLAVAITVTIALVATFMGNDKGRPPQISHVTDQNAVIGERMNIGQEAEKIPTEIPGKEIYHQAMDALLRKHFTEAIGCFEELQRHGNGMQKKIAVPYAQALTGQAGKLAKTDTIKAVDLLARAIQLNPNSEEAHFQLGMLYLKLKDHSHAIKKFQDVIAIKPDSPDSYFNLGFIYALEKNYRKAEEMYGMAVELNPDYIDEALFNLAVVQNELGKKIESVANLEKAVSLNPNNTSAVKYLNKMKESVGIQQ